MFLKTFFKSHKKTPTPESLFFNTVAGLKSETLLKAEAPAQLFSCEFCIMFKNTFFTETMWVLLVSVDGRSDYGPTELPSKNNLTSTN